MITAAILTAALVGGPGMGLAISPGVVTGPQISHSQFTYTDAGSTVETVTVQAESLKAIVFKGQHGWAPLGVASFATVTPSRFEIMPGHKQVIRVEVKSTDNQAHNLAILATADGNSVSSGGRISASVGARYVVTSPVTTLTDTSNPTGPIVVALSVLAALLLSVSVWARRRAKRSKPPTDTDNPYGFIA